MTRKQYQELFTGDARGVSDVVGYTMIFGVILIVSTTAVTIGFSGVENQRQLQQIQTVENAFELFNEDVETIQSHKDPKKQTPINMQTGSIGYSNATTITIGARNNGEFTTENTSIQTRTIQYKSQDTILTYDNGIVFNNKEDRKTLTHGSTDIVIGDNKAIIPVVVITPVNADTALSPSGEITIESNYVSNTQTLEARTVETTGDALWIEITSNHPAAWKTQLEKDGLTNVSASKNTTLAKLTTTDNTPTNAQLSTTTIQTQITD